MNKVIFDANYLLNRVLHLEGFFNLTTSTSVFTGGVLGTLKSLVKVLEDIPAEEVIFCWDGGWSKRRLLLYPDYKRDRLEKERTEEDFIRAEKFLFSKGLLIKLLPNFGVRSLAIKGKEGDDLCAFIKSLFEKEGASIVIVSDDWDFATLVSDRCSVYRVMSGKLITNENFSSETGFETPYEFLLCASIVGGHDNLKTIPGIGEGTVKKLFKEFKFRTKSKIVPETLEDLFKYCLLSKRKRFVDIANAREQILLNIELVDMSKEQFTLEEVKYVLEALTKPVCFNEIEVIKILSAMEFKALEETYRYWSGKFTSLGRGILLKQNEE